MVEVKEKKRRGLPETVASAAARRWDVGFRCAQIWVEKWGNSVVADDELLSQKLLRETRTPRRLRIRARSIVGPPAKEPGEKGVAAVEAIKDLASLARQTEEHLSATNQRLKEARAQQDGYEESLQTKLYQEFSHNLIQVRRAQIMLGQSDGAVIAREDFERIVGAMAGWIAFAIQRIRDELSYKLVGIDMEWKVAEVLDDELITRLFLGTLARGSDLAAGCGLPPWVVAAFITACGGIMENGEQELAAEVAKLQTEKAAVIDAPRSE